MDTCNICGKKEHSPFRVYDESGKIVLGCVDKFHTESLRGIIGASTSWHFRPEAVKIRRTTALG